MFPALFLLQACLCFRWRTAWHWCLQLQNWISTSRGCWTSWTVCMAFSVLGDCETGWFPQETLCCSGIVIGDIVWVLSFKSAVNFYTCLAPSCPELTTASWLITILNKTNDCCHLQTEIPEAQLSVHVVEEEQREEHTSLGGTSVNFHVSQEDSDPPTGRGLSLKWRNFLGGILR